MTGGDPGAPSRLERLTPVQRALLDQRLRERAAAHAAEAHDAPPVLSFGQERMWMLAELTPELATYTTARVVRLIGRVDHKRLGSALTAALRDHQVLRTRVRRSEDGDPLAVVADPRPAALDVLRAGDEAQARGLVESFIARPFRLEHDDLIRGLLVEIDEGLSWFAISLHHIASDEASRDLLWSYLDAAYAGRPVGPSPQYASFARRQRRAFEGQAADAEIGWWREHLAGAPTTTDLPVDRLRPALPTYRGARLRTPLDDDLVTALRSFGGGHSATLFQVVLSAFAWLVSRWTRTDDVVLGLPVSGRDEPGAEGVIGLFVNTVVLRTDCAGDPSFSALVGRTRAGLLASLAHQRVPFERVVEALSPPRDLSRNPVFQVAANAVSSGRPATFTLGDLVAEAVDVDPGTTKVDLGLLVREREDGGASLVLEYAVDLFAPETVAALADELVAVLRSGLARPDRPLSELSLTSTAQHTRLVEEVNATGAPISPVCVHEAIAAQAGRTPAAVAVADDRAALTHAELDAHANALAHHLRDLGVGPDVVVAVAVPRSVAMMVAVLAVLKSGGAYLPLDTGYPPDRLAFMLEDSRAPVLITDRATRDDLPPHPDTVLMDDLAAIVAARPATPPESGVTPDHLCYVIYTSGSTGRPKGVELRHRGVVNRLEWMQRTLGLTAADTVLQKTPLSFDVSAWEVLWPPMTGARVVMARPDGHRDPAYLAEVIERERVTVTHFVPSMLGAFLEHPRVPALAASGLRAVVCSGEALPDVLKDDVFRLLPDVELFNLYGPTEASIDVTWSRCRPGPAHPVRIGAPIDNVQCYVLDAHRQPVPVGVAGELYLAGVQLARGYLGRPELTAERFVPLALAPDGRAYRTGDLVRWTSAGELDYLGRTDDQVKLRGLRIELGEIDAALAAHPDVAAGCAAVRSLPSGEPVLAGYVVLRAPADDEAATLRAIADATRRRLPAPMVPATLQAIDALPVGLSGKLDRQALPAPVAAHAAVRVTVPPRTRLEEELSALWVRLLGIDDLGVEDDFFQLGGHSLLAAKMMTGIYRTQGVALPLAAVFRSPTIAGLAAEVETARGLAGRPALVRVDRSTRRIRLDRLDDPVRLAEAMAGAGRPDVGADATVFPLSSAQRRMWFLDRLEAGRPIYTVRRAFRATGALEPTRLAEALTMVAGRHEALRTTVHAVGDLLAAVVADEPRWPLDVVDVSGRPVPLDAAREHARSVAARPFDLERGPLATAFLYRLGPEDAVLVLRLHHLLVDGWSLDVIVDELRAVHDALVEDRPVDLAEVAVEYADFAGWQEQCLDECLDEQLEHWRGRMAGAPAVLDLPTDGARTRPATSAGARRSVRLGPELAAAVRDLARREATTPFAVLVGACSAVLARLSGQDDVVVGTVVAGRQHAEVDRTVGLFANTLLLRTDASGDPSFAALVRRASRTLADAQDHQDVPFERLVEELAPERDATRTPLFQVMLNLLPSSGGEVGLAGPVVLTPFELESPFTRFDLGFTFSERADDEGGELVVVLDYRTDLFEPGTIDRLLARLQAVLGVGTDRPDTRLGDLPLLTSAEERALVDRSTNRRRPDATTAIDLIAAQVERRPGAVAVSAPGHPDLTFAELWRRAGNLAHRLERRGAGPVVGVRVGRHPGLVVAALAVWRAGRAYLPLDDSYPEDRRRFMLEDAGVSVVLTEADLDGPADRGGHPDDAGPPEARADDLAYLIYTSGSTGRPKGVEVEHRALANLLQAMAETVGFSESDRLAAVTTFSFDIAGLELFLPLVAGGSVVVLDRDTAGDPRRLAARLEDHDVTVLQATPSTWRMLLADDWPGRATLTALCGGEALTPDLATALRPRVGALWNCYGPTETTIWSTMARIDDPADVTIGTPVLDTATYVLDPRGRLAPPGTTGELWIGGGGVARGYHGRPDLTAERFVADPWQPGRRMYRTGDLAAWTPEGALRCLGRTDSQVKLRGHRIELGEIEALLEAQAAVDQAAVALRLDHDGEARLIGYVVGRTDGVLDALRAALPPVMVPTTLVALDAMPRTDNNKIDRSALPAPVLIRGAGTPPATAAELTVARIWADLLPVGTPVVEDDFFDLGGHSLLATRLTSRLSAAFAAPVELRTVFDHPTLGGLAAAMPSGPTTSGPGPVPLKRTGRWLDRAELGDHAALEAAVAGRSGREAGEVLVWPLSAAQKRMWLLHQLAPEDADYNVTLLRRLRGPVDPDTLSGALAALVARHELLRTTYTQVDDVLAQAVWPPERAAPAFAVVDAHGQEWDDVLSAVRADASRPFRLADGPDLRVTLTRLDADDWLLLVAVHHIALDGWSIEQLLGELATFYTGGDLAPAPLQFGDYAVWEAATDDSASDAAHWAATMAGAPLETTFPTTARRTVDAVARGRRVRRSLPPDLVAGVDDLARARHATPFMVLTAAVSALLSRHGAGPDVVLGTPVATRSFAGGEGLLGPLINTVPLRVPVRVAAGFGAHLDATAQVCRDAYAHSRYPFERLVSELNARRDATRHPVFQVLVALQDAGRDQADLGRARVSPVEIDWARARFDASFSWSVAPGRIELVVEYRDDLYPDPVGPWLADRFETFLAAALAEPTRPLESLPLPGADEAALVAGWRTDPAPTVPLLPGLVRAMAERDPDLPAVEVGGTGLTFGELLAASDRLAHRLRDAGVRAGDAVALLVGHELTWPVGVLGAWRLAAHVVPIDPHYPPARQRLMLEDSRCTALVLPDGAGPAEHLPDVPVVPCDPLADLHGPEAPGPDPGWPDVTPEHCAYLIYTSGSTGTPKAARVPHRAVAALAHAVRTRFWDDEGDLRGRRVAVNAPVSFDFSIGQLVHLAFGSCLVLVPDEVRRDARGLVDFIRGSRLDILDVTPTHLRMLIEAGLVDGGRPGRLLVGGEAVPQDLWDVLRDSGMRCWNVYGPTEATVYSTVVEVSRSPTTTIGSALPGMRTRIVDGSGADRPVGVAGELWLAGPQVADGYVDRPELTAQRFQEFEGERWYLTGDVVRSRPDGNLDFVGRVDDQVKIRGFRIEPGEVVHALRDQVGVGDAAVVPEGGELVGYVVPAPGTTWDPAGLRQLLRASLPGHLVPAVLVPVSALPLTPTGKLDGQALRSLPRPDQPTTGGLETRRKPTGPAEELVAELWSELLGVSEVSAEDDFFDLGGDSLSASRLVARLRALGIDLPLMAVFTHPTVADLAGPVTELLLAQMGDAR